MEALYFGDSFAADLTLFFGKILRVDVTPDGDTPYTIPSDNPFADRSAFPDYLPEIYAWGIRNPFRISFDLQDGAGGTTFYMSASADTLFESTYKVTEPGNYGWSTREGSHCIARSQPLNPPEFVECTVDIDCPQGPQNITCGSEGFCTCPTTDALGYELHMPYLEYINHAASEHPETQLLLDEGKLEQPKGRASLGGHMYRGSEIPWLVGKFIQADFAVEFLDGLIFVVNEDENGATTVKDGFMFDPDDESQKGFLKSIGKDAKGELYAITGDFTPDFSSQIGRIWKIVDATDAETPVPEKDNGETPDPEDNGDPTPTSSTGVVLPLGWLAIVSIGMIPWVLAI